jgi:hypothetical protein
MKEAIRYSETAVFTRNTQRHIPENILFHSHSRENLQSYTRYFPSKTSLKLANEANITITGHGDLYACFL